ncbi:hypothetical protein [uncultured Microscilla sp.]|uniref:hypothetical protein n=1 Tax=uncultured Microscilla sp. TaxID=432653 RepID=UPI0026213DF3|nr:hypothetical protein [uncultured Microscilla sp.]
MKPLNFILWKPEGAPEFSPGGATFADGTTIELASAAAAYVQENSLELTQTSFIITLNSDEEELASHTFQMEKLGGSVNLWLLANPKETDPNGSFTGKFLQALCDLAPAQTPLTIKIGVIANDETTWINEGNLIFDGTTGSETYQQLLTFYDDVDASRSQANKETTEAYAQKREEEAQARHNANHFEVFFKSNHPSQTTYVICKDTKSLSENIVEVQPNAKISVEFWRGSSHEILAYSQNVSKEAAHKVTTVTETLENQEILI